MSSVAPVAHTASRPTRAWLWIDRSIVAFTCAAVSYTLLAWLLAAVGAFTITTASAAIGFAALLGVAVASRIRVSSHAPEVDRVSVLVVLIMVVSFIGWGIKHSGEHIITDRDPGVYSTASLWLATHGNLQIGFEAESADLPSSFTNSSQGLRPIGDSGRLQPGFMQGTVAWLATWTLYLGAASLFWMNAFVSGLAGLVIFFVGLRLGFGRFALMAVALALFNPITLYVTRDVFSEPIVLLMIVCSAYLLVAAVTIERPHLGMYAVSGLAVGATALFRIDGPAYVIGWSIALLLIFVIDGSRVGKSGFAAAIPWVIAGSVSGTAWILALRTAPLYIDVHSDRAVPLWTLAAAVVMTGAVAGVLVSRYDVLRHRLRTVLVASTFRWSIVIAALVLSAWFGVLRPAITIDSGSPPSFVSRTAAIELKGATPFAFNSPVVDSARTYFEQSALWQIRYWGIAVVATSLAALVLAALGAGNRRMRLALIVVGALLLPALVLYLQSPSITPDHLWAMRRYVPFTVPLFSLLSVFVVTAVFRLLSLTGVGRTRRVLVGGFVVGVLLWTPIARVVPILHATEYVGFVGSIRLMCDHIPDDGAVVMVGTQYRDKLQGPVRSICDVPVVAAPDGTSDADVVEALDTLRSAGLDPVVLLSADRRWNAPPIVTHEFVYRITEWTVTEPPRRQVEVPFGWALYPSQQVGE